MRLTGKKDAPIMQGTLNATSSLQSNKQSLSNFGMFEDKANDAERERLKQENEACETLQVKRQLSLERLDALNKSVRAFEQRLREKELDLVERIRLLDDDLFRERATKRRTEPFKSLPSLHSDDLQQSINRLNELALTNSNALEDLPDSLARLA